MPEIDEEKFRKLYEKAVKEKSKTFFYGDQEVLTAYARYLILHIEAIPEEYLKTKP